MPKIVDHDALRADLARRAIPVFQAHGYHGIGMRKIAEALGVPKSSLYHYFPTKQDLFIACTGALDLSPAEPEPDPVAALVQMIARLEESFSGELRLMVDYVGARSRAEIADDAALTLYRERMDAAIRQTVGPEWLPLARALVYGLLLDRWLAGESGDLDGVRRLIEGTLGAAADAD
ncbi:TetR/AcrR family transcriptional regulator [Salinarimonas chemoclinalis]|uniref:TetR/AcrR family transcriptional regulator n=1 Tax=Salinarimonas chemoclinalis TaxID=3241599 RepID=UPI003557081B